MQHNLVSRDVSLMDCVLHSQGLGSTVGDYLWIAAVSIAPASVRMLFKAIFDLSIAGMFY